MAIQLQSPGVDGSATVAVLAEWQREGAPMQLHPGDLGWSCRFGVEAMAGSLRTWSRAGEILAVGQLDDTELRLAVAPQAQQDDVLAARLADDLGDPGRGLLPAGQAAVEAPAGSLVREVLGARGWTPGQSWSPLRRDLSEPVPDPGLRVEVIGPDRAHIRTAVQRAAFDGSTFTDERWHAMAAGVAYADARCLVAFDDEDSAVAAVTVWSAGPGRSGLLEPMGTHRDHRGRGFGTAMNLAAAAALKQMGCSSALVCTPSSNAGAVATYQAAGFQARPEVRDLCREA